MAVISKDEMKDTGERIKQIRFSNSMDQSVFGEQFDPPASASNVSRWERGINLPSKKRLEVIAKLGRVTVDYLLHGTPHITPEQLEKFKEKAENDNLSLDEKQLISANFNEESIFNRAIKPSENRLIKSFMDPEKLSDNLRELAFNISLFFLTNRKNEKFEIVQSLNGLFETLGEYQVNMSKKSDVYQKIEGVKKAIEKDE